MIDNGDVLRFDADGRRGRRRATAGRVLIDGTRTGEVGDEVLRDRRHLSGDGLVVPVLAVNMQLGELAGVPEIITRGFVVDEPTEALLRRRPAMLTRDARRGAASRNEPTSGLIRERVRVELQRVLRRKRGAAPARGAAW